MREIKFRAWNVLTKTMIDLKKVTPLALNIETDGLFIPFSGMPLMQYTGLKDCNGQEIYEGDVLKDETTHPLKIIWRDCGFAFEWFDLGTLHREQITTISDDFDTQTGQFRYLEVIGNIHSNPELLEQK